MSTVVIVDHIYDKYTIAGLYDAAGNPAKIYWSGSNSYKWQGSSGLYCSEHNILSSSDFKLNSGEIVPQVANRYHGYFEWTNNRPSNLERFDNVNIDGTVTKVCMGVYEADFKYFFMTHVSRWNHDPNRFGHSNDFGLTYGMCTSKAGSRKGKFVDTGTTWDEHPFHIVSIVSLTETFGNLVQGSISAGSSNASYAGNTYAIAPLGGSSKSYGYDNTVDSVTWSNTTQTSQLNNLGMSVSSMKNNMEHNTKPASVVWSDCTWPVYVKWNCDISKYPRDIIYNDFVNVDKRNRAIRCGLVLCNVTKKGNYTIKCKPSVAGKVVLYHSATAQRYQTDTIATLQEYTVSAGTESALEYEVSDFVNDDAIWILFLPTSGIGYIDINNIELEYEN